MNVKMLTPALTRVLVSQVSGLVRLDYDDYWVLMGSVTGVDTIKTSVMTGVSDELYSTTGPRLLVFWEGRSNSDTEFCSSDPEDDWLIGWRPTIFGRGIEG